MSRLAKKAGFLQSMSSPQSSSKSMVIHLYFMLLIAIENTTILKSTKSVKSNNNSTLSLCHAPTPENLLFLLTHTNPLNHLHPFDQQHRR
jgi:hypothetical protein